MTDTPKASERVRELLTDLARPIDIRKDPIKERTEREIIRIVEELEQHTTKLCFDSLQQQASEVLGKLHTAEQTINDHAALLAECLPIIKMPWDCCGMCIVCGNDHGMCIVCGNDHTSGHTSECTWQALIARIEKALEGM